LAAPFDAVPGLKRYDARRINPWLSSGCVRGDGELFWEESYFCTLTPNRLTDSGELRQGVGRREETLQTAFAGRLEQASAIYKQNSRESRKDNRGLPLSQ